MYPLNPRNSLPPQYNVPTNIGFISGPVGPAGLIGPTGPAGPAGSSFVAGMPDLWTKSVGTTGANYTTVYGAIEAGYRNLVLTTNVTDTNQIVLRHNTTITLKTDITWTLDNINIDLAGYYLTVRAEGYGVFIYNNTSANKPIFISDDPKFVQLENLFIRNASTGANSPLSNNISIYMWNCEYTAGNTNNCGINTTAFSYFIDSFFYGGGTGCTNFIDAQNCTFNNTMIYMDYDDSTPIHFKDCSINGLHIMQNEPHANTSMTIENTTLTGLKNKMDYALLLNIGDPLGSTAMFSTVSMVNGTIVNIDINEPCKLSDVNVIMGTINIKDFCNITNVEISGDFHFYNGYASTLSNGRSRAGNLLVDAGAEHTIISNTFVNGITGPDENSVKGPFTNINNCFFFAPLNIENTANNSKITGCTIGYTGTNNTIKFADGANFNIATSNFIDSVIIDSGVGNELANNVVF